MGRLDKRMNEHRSDASKCTALKRAIARYGWKAMQLKIVWEGPAEMLNQMERKFIADGDTFGEGGYNLTPGGDAEPGENVLLSDKTLASWQKDDVRKRHSEGRVQAWKDPQKRESWVSGMKAGRANPIHQASRTKTLMAKREAALASLPPEKREKARARLERERIRNARRRGTVPIDWDTASSKSPPSAACALQDVDESTIPSDYEEGEIPGYIPPRS